MEYIQFLNIVTWVDTFFTMVIPLFIIILVNSLVLRTIIRGPLQFSHSVVISNGKKPRSAHKKMDTFLILGSMKKTFCKPTNTQILNTDYGIHDVFVFKSSVARNNTVQLIFVGDIETAEYFLLQEVTMVLCNFEIYAIFGRNFKTSLMFILKCRSATEERRRLMLKGFSANNSTTTPL
ncbi:LOW QUALITY PROTEIN: hypothetical protein MAR_034759 [Mya arenaria]|uniref:ATP synthase F0 subunit 8 n=1 Tax=Mya arenaria TaxID=6604 RepID=A0ABY7EM25_MYAAR|nr:LOW QUALITY PROTEIN: hypothetical protein MAR_034759 [Mya arenaria]